ncbi:hypothetical protein LC55x_2462 [Lysobacter capsici]|uniref:hypothetical protein n=1 Tax=Lysobacter capsici TaxID=435897 RepID=UPI0007167701|nr:hypothetical protein [Lysobacter capsici]ALN85727.1 hypothetical protein LC55x_2462 [Lysobacter capsici]
MVGLIAALANLWPDAGSPWPYLLLAGLVLALAALMAWLLHWLRSRSSREAMARRADRNGLALLALADEMECHLYELALRGYPVRQQRHWPRLCRRLAMDHLECINWLMLDERMREPAPRDPPA